MDESKPKIQENWPRGVFRGQVYAFDPEKKEIYFLDEKGETESGPQSLSIWLYGAGFVPTDKAEETWLHQGGKFVWSSNPVKLGFQSPIPGIYKYENNNVTKNTKETDEKDVSGGGVGKTIGYIAGGTALVGALAFLARKAFSRPAMISTVGVAPALPYKPTTEHKSLDVLVDVLHDSIDTNPKGLRSLESPVKNLTDTLIKTLNKEPVFNIKLCQDVDTILSSDIVKTAPYTMPNIEEFMEIVIDHDTVSGGEVVQRFQKLLDIGQFFNSTEAYSLDNQIKKVIYDAFSALNEFMMEGRGNGFELRYIYNQLFTIKGAIASAEWNVVFASLNNIYRIIQPQDSEKYSHLVESVSEQDVTSVLPKYLGELKRANESYLSALSAPPQEKPKLQKPKGSGFGSGVLVERDNE